METEFDRIKAMMKAKNMTQQELADAIGRHLTAVNKAFTRQSGLKSDMPRIAEILGVSYSWLMTGRDDGPEAPQAVARLVRFVEITVGDLTQRLPIRDGEKLEIRFV